MQIISIQVEENCLKIVDELMEKQQHLKGEFVTQNTNVEKAQAQIEEERKKFLAIDRWLRSLSVFIDFKFIIEVLLFEYVPFMAFGLLLHLSSIAT